MDIVENLDAVIDDMRALPPERQARIVQALRDLMVEERADGDFDAGMRSDTYRAYVERELAAGREDRLNGRVSPADEAFDRVEAAVLSGDG